MCALPPPPPPEGILLFLQNLSLGAADVRCFSHPNINMCETSHSWEVLAGLWAIRTSQSRPPWILDGRAGQVANTTSRTDFCPAGKDARAAVPRCMSRKDVGTITIVSSSYSGNMLGSENRLGNNYIISLSGHPCYKESTGNSSTRCSYAIKATWKNIKNRKQNPSPKYLSCCLRVTFAKGNWWWKKKKKKWVKWKTLKTIPLGLRSTWFTHGDYLLFKFPSTLQCHRPGKHHNWMHHQRLGILTLFWNYEIKLPTALGWSLVPGMVSQATR